MDYIDLALRLPAAPLCAAVDMPLVAPVASELPEGSRQGAASWELQTPNLKKRLDYAISRARDTISPQDRREWTEEAFSLVERLVDTEAVCDCGVAYNAGRCDECDENERIMSALRTTAGEMAFQRDEGVPF